jgi:TonB family protein
MPQLWRCAALILLTPTFAWAQSGNPTPPPSDTQTTQPSDAAVTGGMLLHKVEPKYPRKAKRNRIQGTVVLRAVIGKDGLIKDLRVISGPEELISPSVRAVRQWVYRPYLLKGEPVEVDTQVSVNYALSVP